MLAVASFPWSVLDPSRSPFSATASDVAAIVAPLVAEAAASLRSAQGASAGEASDDGSALRETCARRIDLALVGAHGAWAGGWEWSTSEPGNGGLVRAWCCTSHSMLPALPRARPSGPFELEAQTHTVERIVAALFEWRATLDELASLFAELPLGATPAERARDAERAAARLLSWVLERNEANDAWYATFATVLGWFFEARGVPAEVSAPIIDEAIGGRFASWVEPDSSVASDVTRAVGAGHAAATGEGAPPQSIDATAAWLGHRTSSMRSLRDLPLAGPVAGDAHRAFVEGPEHARDPVRAARMGEALGLARRWAEGSSRLTFEELARWQGVVLGVAPDPAPFRSGDAFAKRGRERYPLEVARARFATCLAQVDDEVPPAARRAARAYLDVCFFHPFEDGNGRAARLVLDAVLHRAKLALHAVTPLYALSRDASDEGGAWSFAWLVEYLAGPAERREPR